MAVLLTAQPDWDAAIAEGDPSFWVFSKLAVGNEPTHHGSIVIKRREAVALSSLDKFEATYQPAAPDRSATLTLTDVKRHASAEFLAPRRTYRGIVAPRALSLDISPGGELGIVGGADGKLEVFLTEDGSVSRRLEGHVGDVDTCRFFPSGKVALSADLALRIWDLETGACAAVLGGHQRGVTDTAVVERGRNILSVSRDGTCRLWDCGTQQQLAIVADAGAAINQSAIASGSGDQSDGGGVERSVKKKGSSTVRVSFLGNSYWGPSVGSLSPYTVFSMNGWKMRCYPRAGDREVGTEGKVVALACEDRSARLVDLYSRRQIAELSLGSAATSCASLGDSHWVFGAEDGSVSNWDARQPKEPMSVTRVSDKAVLSLAVGPNGRILASCGDGRVTTVTESPVVLSGVDSEPCYRVCALQSPNGKTLAYTAARDGSVRCYAL